MYVTPFVNVYLVAGKSVYIPPLPAGLEVLLFINIIPPPGGLVLTSKEPSPVSPPHPDKVIVSPALLVVW